MNLNPNQLDAKRKFQDFYKKIGYKPKDPTSALNELAKHNFLTISDNSNLLENNLPFLVKIKVILNDSISKEYKGKREASIKSKAKALACANICEQFFLEYDKSSLKVSIEKIDKGNIFRLL